MSEEKKEERTAPDSDIPKEEKAFISEYLALSQDGLLIKKGNITVRMFSVVAGATVVAFTFSELADSFIVGFPAAVSTSTGPAGDGIVARMVSPVPMVRLYKAGISVSAMPPPRFLLAYLLACRSQLINIPGFFDEDRRTQVDSLITILKKAEGLSEIKTAKSSSNTLTAIDPFSSSRSNRVTQTHDKKDSFEDTFGKKEEKPIKWRH